MTAALMVAACVGAAVGGTVHGATNRFSLGLLAFVCVVLPIVGLAWALGATW